MTGERQNKTSESFLQGSDLAEREQAVLQDASQRTGFIPEKVIGRSSWWGSTEIGAFHYGGEYKGKPAVIKIQGIKPETSEITMLEKFAAINKSKKIRPPHLYASLPWDDERRYEALVLEYITGPKVIQVPTTVSQVQEFFNLYQDYRVNCRQDPWLDKPDKPLSVWIPERFSKWREASQKLFPQHPFHKDEDKELVDQAVSILQHGYQNVDPDFQHGHFSANDLYQQGDQAVLLSNLYWSWRQPFYDAVFGYHWFMLSLSGVSEITPKEVEQQRAHWLQRIQSLPRNKEERRLLNLALLERAAAGLNLDALSIPQTSLSEYLVEKEREQVKELIAAA